MNFLKCEFSKDIKKNYLDLISKNNKFINDPFYLKTLNLWGKGIHVRNKKKHKVNDTHIEKLLEYFKNDLQHYNTMRAEFWLRFYIFERWRKLIEII